MKVQKVVRSDHDKEFVPFPTMEPPDVPLWAWLEAYRPAWAQGSEGCLCLDRGLSRLMRIAQEWCRDFMRCSDRSRSSLGAIVLDRSNK